jgi:hypothetical protein
MNTSTSSATQAPTIKLVMRGTFSASDRGRILYRVLLDNAEIGTAICWTKSTKIPWSLTLRDAYVVGVGYRSSKDLLAAVERFLVTGEI